MKLPRAFVLAASSVAIVTAASAADAQQKPAAKPAPAEINITVTARPMRPSAVVDLGKILPEIELSKLRQEFYKQIESLLLSEPF
jgi:hypothetical protein